MDLLQIATGITKCDDYYKLRQYIRPAGSHFCSACCSECLNEHTRVKLQHNKEIMMFIFYLMVLSMCNCLKAFDTRGILSTPASD